MKCRICDKEIKEEYVHCKELHPDYEIMDIFGSGICCEMEWIFCAECFFEMLKKSDI